MRVYRERISGWAVGGSVYRFPGVVALGVSIDLLGWSLFIEVGA